MVSRTWALAAALLALVPASSGSAPSSRAPREGAPADAVSDPSGVLQLEIDPLLEVFAPGEGDALEAEAWGARKLHLSDGDVLRGRVVARGIEMDEDAVVFVEDGAEILSLGDVALMGSLVPIASTEADPQATRSVATRDALGVPGETSAPLPIQEEDELELHAVGAASVSCDGVVRQRGARGRTPRPTSMRVRGDFLAGPALFGPFCAGRMERLPVPGVVPVVGARSAIAVGGRGGDGGSLSLRVSGTLTFMGAVCNEAGADGAAATATGAPAVACGDCGGDASARGGNGGRAGNLNVRAGSIVFMAMSVVTVSAGGAGGDATASGGAGGDCPMTCARGGRGGHAIARGGAAGRGATRVSFSARTMAPAPAAVLAAAIVAPGASGGSATATAGPGGDGGGGCPCGMAGGAGGPGGNASAEGGKAASGYVASARAAAGGTVRVGFDAGDGGAGTSTGGNGGTGGTGGSCTCEDQATAGRGGPGGPGGDARAKGGAGGAASLMGAIAGNGGASSATCGNGGNGGASGDCTFVMTTSNPCAVHAVGGPGGAEGEASARSGLAGRGRRGATSGASPAAIEGPCAPGLPGPGGTRTCDD